MDLKKPPLSSSSSRPPPPPSHSNTPRSSSMPSRPSKSLLHRTQSTPHLPSQLSNESSSRQPPRPPPPRPYHPINNARSTSSRQPPSFSFQSRITERLSISTRSQLARSSFEGIQPQLESPLSSWKCTKADLCLAAGVTACVIYFGLTLYIIIRKARGHDYFD
ncbi:hypothetical protein P8452_05640 [Trifolium repens]|nr:hypothetical protein QL285_006221 [Trifolium repens]WJX15504.1 hypothetical protein P8452_05640 [Trifolium repens]